MTEKTPSNRKWAKYGLIFLAFLLVVGFLTSGYIKNKALEKITAFPGITCKNVDFNLFSGCLDLENVEIDRTIGTNKTEKLKLTTTKAHLHGLGYWQFWKNNRLSIDDLLLEDFTISIQPDDSINTKIDTAEQGKQPKIEEILVHQISLQQGKFSLQNKDYKAIKLDCFEVQVEKLQFFLKRDSQKISWQSIELLGSQLLLDGHKSDNQLIANKIELSADENLQIQDFRWKPKYSKTTYLKHHKFRKSRIDVIIPTIEIRQFPLYDLVFEQKLKVNSITTRNGVLKIYSDKNKPPCTDCLKTYHYEDLIASDLMIDIDSIAIKNSEIVLEELGEGKTKAGKLDWSNVYASIYNLTNNKIKAKSHPNTVADIQAVFVDDGKVKLHFEFPNFNKNADYRFNGSLDRVKLKEINSFLVFSKQFRIKQGEVNSFAFNGRGNLVASSGEMELRYNSLELQLLKRDRTPRKFLSKVANALFNKEKNPNKDNKLRKGRMYSEREKNKSFIGNWWKTIQSGIKSTMLPNILLPDELETRTR